MLHTAAVAVALSLLGSPRHNLIVLYFLKSGYCVVSTFITSVTVNIFHMDRKYFVVRALCFP
jgi:hypothetical protein